MKRKPIDTTNSSTVPETGNEANGRRCGFVAIVGRPNVGKSTLLNHLLQQKISITSRKPQTTRHRIIGIHTSGNCQCVFVDTPGLHGDYSRALNKAMNDTVFNVIKDVDAVLFVIERLQWSEADELVLKALSRTRVPVLLVINKIDQIDDKSKLLPHIEKIAKKRQFAEVVPVSALGGHNLDTIIALVARYLPAGPFLFPEDQVTDRSSRFIAAEIIREKVTRQLGDELPYEVSVEIEKYEQIGRTLHIYGLILVDKAGQKKIIVGKDGDRLKLIGTAAREDMEVALQTKIMLNLWVKVKSGWADDERALLSLGYIDP